MKGTFKFCPVTGAELGSEDYHTANVTPTANSSHNHPSGNTAATVSAKKAPQVVPERGDDIDAPLTNGAKKSNTKALTRRFHDCFKERHETTPSQLMVTASNAIRSLRKQSCDAADTEIWYALTEHLYRRGYDVEWMFDFAEPACYRCGSVLIWERAPNGEVMGRCAANCDSPCRSKPQHSLTRHSLTESDKEGEYQNEAIALRIRSLYNETFAQNGGYDPIVQFGSFNTAVKLPDLGDSEADSDSGTDSDG